jgi:preprotein translocase subunit SecA
MAATWSAIAGSFYPERDEFREGKLERAVTAARYRVGGLGVGRRQLARIVSATDAAGGGLARLEDGALLARAAELRPPLRRSGIGDLQLTAGCFALVREAAARAIGQRHFAVQLIGGWAMLRGMLAEMETGEGKTLAATLAASTAALAGRVVHIITVNDYLAERDARSMGPIYRALGLTVGCVRHGMTPELRRAAYRRDIVYCSNKEIAFDYLRDRMVLGGKPRAIAARMDALSGSAVEDRLLLRGLQFAIVDEADSVLVDEARTPLILSAQAGRSQEEDLHRNAFALARQLSPHDYRIDKEGTELTNAGIDRLDALSGSLGGVWRGPRRREQLVRQALNALHVFQRDKHYLVRDGKVVIIDENTGRLMPDRSWEQGLHQLVEIKEEVEVTGRRETLARISYQRFFRRYLHLCGMTGTATEVGGELWSVYRLRVARIPTNRPVRRRRLPEQVHRTSREKWAAVVAAIRERHASGQPVLVGTRTVAASEQLAKLLDEARLPYRLLNARQDADEAQIVAEAGEAGRITVATNMAGRGTDIKLGASVGDCGGLHVICTERHDSARIDRQLLGRCGRQGDPGSCQAVVSLDDDLPSAHLPALPHGRWLAWLAGRPLLALAQWRAERLHSMARRDLLNLDDYLGDQLAFSGRGE